MQKYEEEDHDFEEIDGIRKMNIKNKKKLQKYEEEDHDLEETEKTIIILKNQLK